MIDVFSGRSLVYWWGALTTTVFLNTWLRQIAKFFTDSKFFNPNALPFSLVPGVNDAINGTAEYVRDQVGFDPQATFFTAGNFVAQNWVLALVLGIILLILGGTLYVRALRSPMLFDDFFALFVFYFLIKAEGHIFSLARIPVLENVKAIADNPTIAYLVLMVLMFVLVFFGEGLRSRRAFWRGLFEATFVSIFLFPVQTAWVLAWLFNALADLGVELGKRAEFGVLWGLLGAVLTLTRLYISNGAPIVARGGRFRAARDESSRD